MKLGELYFGCVYIIFIYENYVIEIFNCVIVMGE